MTTILLIFGGIGLIWALVVVSRKWGESKIEARIKADESKMVRKAKKIEDDHKNDSRDDIINGL